MDHDLVIIGGGAGGLAAALSACWVKADVLLINDGPLGGDCTFTGCVPSKALLHAARSGIGFTESMVRVQEIVQRIAATENADVLRSRGVKVIEDRARLVTHDTVVVGEQRITAPRILVATGSRPARPPIPGLADVPYLTNETVFSLTDAPRTLGIIGGGPIGCELAEAFACLGVAVTIFTDRDRLLDREEPAASAIVQRSLVALGITVRTGVVIEAVSQPSIAARVNIRFSHPGVDDSRLDVDQLLVAAGRQANTEGLGLEHIGVTLTDQGDILTNDRLRTDVRGVYAAGDVTGKLLFTHAADEMGRLAAGNALGKGMRGRYRPDRTPWVTFTSPEVARIGVTEAEAASQDGVRIAELPLDEMDRAITDGSEDGFIKLIAGPRRGTGRLFGGTLIGSTIVAPRAGEMIHEVALAMRTQMFTGRLAQTAHAYPTWSYGIQKTAGQFFGSVEGRRARRPRE